MLMFPGINLAKENIYELYPCNIDQSLYTKWTKILCEPTFDQMKPDHLKSKKESTRI